MSGHRRILPELGSGLCGRGLPAAADAETHAIRPLQAGGASLLSGQTGLVPAGSPGLPATAAVTVAPRGGFTQEREDAAALRLHAALLP